MKDYKYTYIITHNKIIALSSYAGKTVRGVAKCHPGDNFDENFGKKLAAARCNLKIAIKRYARARDKYNEIVDEYTKAAELLKERTKFLEDTYVRLVNARKELDELNREF